MFESLKKKKSSAQSKAKKLESELGAYLDTEEHERQFDVRAFKRIWKEILSYKKILWLGIVGTVIMTLATLAGPMLIGKAIDDAIIPKDWGYLKILGSIFLVLEILRVGTYIMQEYVFNLLGQKVMQDLRIRTFAHIHKLPTSVFDKTPAGRLVTRVTNDISALADMFTAGFISVLGNVAFILGNAFFLLYLNFRLGLIALAVVPLVVWISIKFSQRLKVSYRNMRARLSGLNAYLAENIMGMRVVELFNRQPKHKKKFADLNQWQTDAQLDTLYTFAWFMPVITIAAGISIGLLVWFGGRAVLEGVIQPGVLVAFFTYTLHLFYPMREIADRWNFFLSGMASAERLYGILDWTAEKDLPMEFGSVSRPPGIKGEIEFDRVWFAYKEGEWVLKDFSAKILPGQQIGVVGPTGSGKTTMMALLMRFYDYQKGEIRLDGKLIQDYDKRELRSLFGMIQQDVFMFSGSVRDNIELFKPDANKSAMKETIRSFSLEKRFDGSGGLEVELHERGGNLSMGQKQVLAFSRASHAKPDVWILDEATANMDSDTERELDGLLKQVAKGKTTMIIAHRLSTIRHADQIFVLNKGSLVESGSHEALLETDGLYSRLYRFQESVI